jgi:TRAP-type C4-dicarboxylate transport system substrate-binding protein
MLLFLTGLVGCGASKQSTAEKKAAGTGSAQSVAKGKSEQPIELTFAGLMPPSSPWETKVMVPYLEEITKQTNGRVKITTYPGGTLLEGGKIYDGVAIGVADMGHESLSWVNGRFLVSDILKKSGVPFKSGEAASRTFKELVSTLNPKEFHDVKVLMLI